MKEFEKVLKESMKKHENDTPLYIKETIRNVDLTSVKKRKNNVLKRNIAAGLIVVSLSTSVVFATNISDRVNKFFNNNKGMDIAIENGYIETSKMDYVHSAGVDVKLNNILMTDNNLSFSINLKLPADLDIQKIEKLMLSNLIIVDNENRILYCEDEKTFNEFIRNNSLDYKYNETFDENYINPGINYYIKTKQINSNEIELVYNLTAENFPLSKSINISFEEIFIESLESIKGEWDIMVDLPEKFYNRESVEYKVVDSTNEKLVITKATLNDTNMRVELEIKEDVIYEENDTPEIINNKISEKLEVLKEEFEKGDLSNLQLFGEDVYIETSEGEKYFPTNSSSEDSGYADDYMTGVITYWQTFDLTKYDISEELILSIVYKGELIKINLECEY